ncbi:hypothetical protein BOSEA31B_12357 [Hyphomicrobiales bacterium]|nr:hypothetical protein BOSEA31B_12357 [Hyphomicrobiales bacterium]CAH1698136.1 hypothetical protein BOSEA1005_11181 [Hyphomicrobiales bacterium]CAI0347779.1 hypothetical protein BO1005MUT1_90140 [Hyphomicrobiales bacterium]
MSAPTLQGYRVQEWLDEGADGTFRSDYNLDDRSIVFDVGGYHGDFAAKIVDRFGCFVFVFEPIQEFSAQIRQRFSGDHRVKVFDYGLGCADERLVFDLDKDATSAVGAAMPGADSVTAEIRRFSAVLHELGIDEIDLVKLNIEGGEYDVISDIENNNVIQRIKRFDIQFHDFVDSADEKMKRARTALSIHHRPIFAFDYVWESWIRKDLMINLDQSRQILDIARLRDKAAQISMIVDQLKEAGSAIKQDQNAQINAIYTKLTADQQDLELRLSAMAAENKRIKQDLEFARARQDRLLETRIRRLAGQLLQKLTFRRSV